jgi:hypothetical protein
MIGILLMIDVLVSIVNPFKPQLYHRLGGANPSPLACDRGMEDPEA